MQRFPSQYYTTSLPWYVDGVFMECLWSVYGVFMECLWSVYGVFMECVWSVYGVCMECVCMSSLLNCFLLAKNNIHAREHAVFAVLT